MASAKPGVHIVRLKPVVVPKYMLDGDKFLKWEEDPPSTPPTPVTLKVDPNGFYLYWTNLNNEVELLDIATIRDTRTGRSSKLPKDLKLREKINYGSGSLEDKILTVVSGPDFVNLNFVNFSGEKGEVVKQWSSDLCKISSNILQLNSPVISFLKKIHTKLTISTDKNGKIPVKNIIKTFTVNKEDKKKVERALLEALGMGVVGLLKTPTTLDTFPFSQFFQFYKQLTNRTELFEVFQKFSNNQKNLSAEQFMDFINKEQRDPRLNEILYPYATPEKAKELIETYEPDEKNKKHNVLSFEGFLRFILSEDNALVSYEKFDLSDDMDQPLCHYFINSSHNTYLTGHQLTGKSSVEMYRQALLAGCRCVELDFWNGREEPVIVHGYTLVPDIPAKEVIEAIAECAFKTSDYPVILSFENHCSPKQQEKIAGYCREYFGEMLLESCLEGFPLEPGIPLPPPSLLKHKIIIKNKKKHHHRKIEERPEYSEESDSDAESDKSGSSNSSKGKLSSESDKGTAGKESEAGAEISKLVNYVQPVHFYSFETSLARSHHYEMSSFDEKQATLLLKERPVEFVNYNKHQLSRVYPRGTRVDSANFMPQLFWNAGCQLVALNYQTMDLAMQLNMGIFELNRRCGYLLKPEFMRRKDRQFDPFAESTVDGIIAGTVVVKIISSQFLTSKTNLKTFIEVEMYGLPTDTIRKRFKTKQLQGLNPVYQEEPFVFKKVVLPELAVLRFVAYEENKIIGHRVLPVLGLRPGYRHIVLRNESGQPLNLPTVFVHICVRDYVPDGLSDFAEALANPIKYQGELERREKMVEVFFAEGEDPTTPTKAPLLPVEPVAAPPISKSWNVSLRKKPSSEEPPPPDLQLTTIAPPPPPKLASYGPEGNKNTVGFFTESIESITSQKSFKEKLRKVQVEVGKKGNGVSKRLLGKKLSRIDLTESDSATTRATTELTSYLSKTLRESHNKQLKLLNQLKEKETAEVMKWIYSWRKEEYRRLSKITKDKNELGRMKREVNTVLVAKGVTERERIERDYEEIAEKLERDLERELGGVAEWGSLLHSTFQEEEVHLLKFSNK